MTLLDQRRYELALAAATGAAPPAPSWDPALHPRLANGRWAHVELNGGLLGSGFGATKGLPTDTQDLHTERVGGRWGYTPERRALHKRIVDEALAGAAKGKAATFTMGSPGAGKSHVVEHGGIAAADAVRVDVDEVRKKLPEYGALQDESDRRADELTQMEASDVTDQILDAALADGRQIVYDGLGTSARYFDRLDRVLDQGYDVKLAVVTVPTEQAIKRVDERFAATGRRTSYWLTRDVSRRVASEFAQLLKDYGGHVDVELWDNSGKAPRRIAHTNADGKLQAEDYDAVLTFLKKRHEKQPQRGPAKR